MVQVTFDTTNDTLDELQDAMRILQGAIERRGGTPAAPIPAVHPHPVESPAVAVAAAAPRLDMPAAGIDEEDETAVDTSFFKITVKHESEETPHAAQQTAGSPASSAAPKGPTLNQLLSESITEDELTRMFKLTGNEPAESTGKPLKHAPADEPSTATDSSSDSGAYLEIVEYTDEKE
jgi:hypothetical protein